MLSAFLSKKLKKTLHIFILIISLAFVACTGSKKYFKAAEKLEKQGLFNEAADYYLVSLQRKPTNVAARIKLKEVGQKHASSLASEFFRNYNTQQLEPSLETFERLKEFTDKTSALDVKLDYPKSYDEDYQKSIENYCQKNYSQAYTLVNQKKFSNALDYIAKVKKYNPAYKTIQQLDIIATCEPLYQSAVNSLESKNYGGALNLLSSIKNKTENYKDSKDLLDLSIAQQTKSFMLFEPKGSPNKNEKEIEDYLFSNFNQVAAQKLTTTKVINNTPFVSLPDAADINATGNIDLIQAIRKATGTDYFYVFDVANKQEVNSGPQKQGAKGYQEVKTRINDTLVKTEYKEFGYNKVTNSRSFSYEFKYKIINAYSNQIVASQTQNLISKDAVEYNEFLKSNSNLNINSLYPYNPQQTALAAQFNARGWRNLFSANSNLKPMEDLKNDAHNKAISVFTNSIYSYIK